MRLRQRRNTSWPRSQTRAMRFLGLVVCAVLAAQSTLSLTLSGGTKREHLDRYAYGPRVIVDSVADLCDTSNFLSNVVPSGNQEDDTVNDLRAWIAANA